LPFRVEIGQTEEKKEEEEEKFEVCYKNSLSLYILELNLWCARQKRAKIETEEDKKQRT
jgi:hypothetical protein